MQKQWRETTESEGRRQYRARAAALWRADAAGKETKLHVVDVCRVRLTLRRPGSSCVAYKELEVVGGCKVTRTLRRPSSSDMGQSKLMLSAVDGFRVVPRVPSSQLDGHGLQLV